MSNVEMEELNTSDNIPIIQITENGIEGFEILCRLCANKSDNLIPIYSEEGMTNDLSTKMNLYLPIKVAETDQLPLQCCFQCATTVLNWHELVVASVEADKRLRELHEEAEKHLQEQELSVKMIPGNEERTEIKQDDESDDGRFLAEDDIKIEVSEEPIANVLEINIKTEPNDLEIANELSETNVKTESTHLDIKNELEPQNNVTMSNEKKYKCKICFKLLAKTSLARHQKRCNIEHPKKIQQPHSCDICVMRFSKKSEMYSHRDVEHKDAPAIEQNSSDSESNVFNLDLFQNQGKILKLFNNCRHFVNDGNIFYECQSCLQIFGKGLEYIEDQISHSSESCIEIDLEDPDLIRALEILDGSKIIKENQTVTHKCQTCQTEILTEVDFIEHQKFHSGGVPINNLKKTETQSFSCHVCSKVFTGKRYMFIHRERFHKIARPLKRVDIWKKYEIEKDGKKYWKCDFCEKLIATKFRFIDHRELHTKSADELKRFICEICAKTFRLKGTLKKHMRTHDNTRNYTCNICGSALKNPEDFKQHMNIHTGNRPYKCDICSKSYRQRTTLWSHKQQVHSNKHKFSCNLCDFKTHQSHNLKLHMLKHTGEKPFVCSVCGDAFRARDTLRSHMYTHKKEKHPCEICGEIFTQPRYLQRHMRAKHRGLEKKN